MRKRTGRLVEDEHLGIGQERPGDIHPLLFGVGKRADASAKGEVVAVEFRESPAGQFAAWAAGDPAEPGRFRAEQEIFLHREIARERRLLADNRDPFLPGLNRAFRSVGQAVEQHQTPVGLLRAAENVDQRALSRAVFAEQSMDFSRPDEKPHVAQRVGRAVVFVYANGLESHVPSVQNIGCGLMLGGCFVSRFLTNRAFVAKSSPFSTPLFMPRILSGIKPTGRLHIGNYFGMMRPAIDWQDKGEALYFIADYHALTTVHDPAALRANTRGVALDFLACGLDPAKAVLFKQSDVPQVCELTWLLSVLTPMGLLERCHAYKDAVARGFAASHGLFAYPVLMAADILIYDSDIVPVGRDQKQHVEVTRDLAIKMNETFGAGLLRLPEPSILPDLATIPGLDGQKMSKSYDNTIELFLEEKALKKKIMGIVTDSTPVEAPKDPATSSIVALYRLFASEGEVAQMEADFRAGGFGYGDFKKRLFAAIWEHFAPARARRAEIESDPKYIDEVLRRGAARANELANVTLRRVRQAMGL